MGFCFYFWFYLFLLFFNFVMIIYLFIIIIVNFFIERKIARTASLYLSVYLLTWCLLL